MGRKRRNIQLELVFGEEGKGEAPTSSHGGPEPPTAMSEPESPARMDRLIEEVCHRENLIKAVKRVRRNAGSPGVDGMTVKRLAGWLRVHWSEVESQLRKGTYKPQPVKRVEIPKPGGGTRQLGIPTVLDRFIQQAILQVLQPIWDPTFSEKSFGFRPGRSAHQAIDLAQSYVARGHEWVVDIDLERFFDRVNHDRLMASLAQRIRDKALLKLLRAYLNAGALEEGLVQPTEEGTPQGGPLSPLLSNIVLDELDHELERRGHSFVRYADDCNVYVYSERAGQRVMDGISRFITKKLKLKVNSEKSAVGRPWERSFLSFTFTAHGPPKRRVAPKAIKRLKKKVREITRRNRSVSSRVMLEELIQYLKGWLQYFGHSETAWELRGLDAWIRRRLRCVAWQQWKRGPRRYRMLRKLGVGLGLARRTAGSPRGPWRISRSQALSIALPNARFVSFGLPSLAAP